MSRIGKQPLVIPKGVTLDVVKSINATETFKVIIKGERGCLERDLPSFLCLRNEKPDAEESHLKSASSHPSPQPEAKSNIQTYTEGHALVIEKSPHTELSNINLGKFLSKSRTASLCGLYRTLIGNMINGVKLGFEKELVMTGVGYKAEIVTQPQSSEPSKKQYKKTSPRKVTKKSYEPNDGEHSRSQESHSENMLKTTEESQEPEYHELMSRLSGRSRKFISDSGITSVETLKTTSREELCSNYGFEKEAVNEIIEELGKLTTHDPKDSLKLYVGYSHAVTIEIPPHITVKLENPTSIRIHGMEKEAVGNFAAKVRSTRPPEPYKGKGISYAGERIRRKAVKASK